MDVTCERCGTEYEFDETLLSGSGTSVKCTNCGHVFKVYPKGNPDTDRTTSTWRLRLKNGASDAIDTLRELQRRISSGELTPDDEIARGDDEWKTLGSIPELETFFQAAGFEIPSGRIPSPLPPVMPSATSESSVPPGTRPRQPTLLGVSPVSQPPGPLQASISVAAEPEELSSELVPSPPTAVASSYRSPYTRDSMPDRDIEDAVFEETAAAAPPVRTSTPPPAYFEDDDDIPELPDRGRSPLRWLLVVVLVGAAALVATQWERVAQLAGFGAGSTLVTEAMSEGDAALAQGHPEAYAAAIAAYGRALDAGGTDDPRLLANLSHAYALTAQARLDEEVDADVGALVSTAMKTAELATMLDRQEVVPRLAYIDALRLAGSNQDARRQLEDVRSVSFSRTPEFFRIDARLGAAEADGRLENGLRSARQAAELAPEGIVYLLLAARAELAADNRAAAKERLDEVLVLEPGHPTAMRLIATVESLDEEVPEPSEEAPEEASEEVPEEASEDPPDQGQANSADEAKPAGEPSAENGPSDDVAPAQKEEKSVASAPPSEPANEEASATTPAPAPKPATPRRRKPASAPKETEYDEYDRLARAASDDAFVDGRPPVLDYESNMTKGRAELAAGNYARARAYFDSALEVHPGSADAMDALGDVATAVSDYASALRYYRVSAQRGRMDGYFKLGQTYEKLGKTEQAVSAYYTYIKRRPQGPHAAEARNAITTLEPRAKLPPEPGPSTAPDSPGDGSPTATSESTP